MPAKVLIHSDLSQFKKLCQRIIIERKKDAATELNKRAIQVLIGAKGYQGAVQLTKKTSPARIKRDMRRKVSVPRWSQANQTMGSHHVPTNNILAARWLKKKGVGKGMSFATWRATVSVASRKIEAHRQASRAFLAAGWLNCVRDLEKATPGLKMTGKSTKGVKLYPNGKASKSFAKAAVAGLHTTACYNAAAEPGTPAGVIVETALEQGISEQIRDMETHLQKELEKSAIRVIRRMVFAK